VVVSFNFKMLKNIKKAYLIGIKGVGMTALAQILQSRGVSISGSDIDEKFFTDKILNKLNIPFVEKFAKENIPNNVGVVIHSVAYNKKNNIEIVEAGHRGLRIMTYPEVLAELFNDTYGIAVAGSHGKSTTAAMLGYILEQAGYDPTVVVGSRVNQWKSNARVGKSKYFVIEADEYKEVFLSYNPKIILITNIDYDHPDYFKTKIEYKNAFDKFIHKVAKKDLITVPNKSIKSFSLGLSLPGEYNQQNAFLAYEAALRLGVDTRTAHNALENFNGIARRFEYYGVYNGAELFDDYAHHPGEIKAVLKAARQNWPKKQIKVLFQPHTYSRTEALFDDFLKSFNDSNQVFILKTYGSVREKGKDVSGKKLAKELGAQYFQNHKEAVVYFNNKLNKNSVLFALGAGDAWRVLEVLR